MGPPPCAQAGSTLEEGQECCSGSMRYQANGGAWCKALPPNDNATGAGRLLTASCQGEGDFCTPSYECCGGLTCQHMVGGYSQQCQPPPCAQAGSTLEEGQECCSGSMRYQANGGAWCKAPSSQPPNGFMLAWSPNPNFCMSVQHN